MESLALDEWASGKPEASASIRKRFVRRANELISHRPFLTDLDDAIAAWNAAYPRFAISAHRGYPPEDFDPAAAGFLYPPRLQKMMGDSRPTVLVDPDFFLPPDREPSRDDLRRVEAAKIPLVWVAIIEPLWSKWWPAERFPNWVVGKTLHPCQRFVTACLIWRPDFLVPDQWIEKHPARVSWTTADLSGNDPKPDSEEVYYRTLYRHTMERLQVMIRAGEQITEELLSREAWAAHEDAKAARSQAIVDEVRTHYPYVWLYPGLNSTDWGALESAAVAAANSVSDGHTNGCLSWQEHTRRLYEEKTSKKKIAFELGVSWGQVHNLLKTT